MDFDLSDKARAHLDRLRTFMDDAVLPAEPVHAAQRAELTADKPGS